MQLNRVSCWVTFPLVLACESSTTAPAEQDSKEIANVAAIVEAEATPFHEVPVPPDVATVPEDAETSESGLAWKILKEGKGDQRPDRYDVVTLEYTGWTPDGRMFDTTHKPVAKRRATLESFPRGFMEGVQLMLPGEKRRFWIPGKLAYGEVIEGKPALKPERPRGMVVYDVELLEYQRGPRPLVEIPDDIADIPKSAKRSKSGLAWRVLEKGVGSQRPKPQSRVFVTYFGWTTDGRMFDTSFALNGRPATFVVKNASIEGLAEVIQMMTVGELRRVWIPEELTPNGTEGFPKGMVVYDIRLWDFRKE